MICPSVKAVDAGTNLYGIDADQLQSDIVIEDDQISGTLKYVTDYVGFNATEAAEQSGNYLALSLTANDGVEITTELVNGTKGPVIVDDGICVYRITDNDLQKIKVTFTAGDNMIEKIYDLTGLNCETDEE